MITDWVDVPFDGPQTLAFRVSARRLAVLREGLRAAYERADGEALREAWRAHYPAYDERRRRLGWRVSAATIRGLLGELRTALDKVRRESAELHLIEDYLENLGRQLRRWEPLVDAAAYMDLAPGSFLGFATRARYQIRTFLAGGPAPLSIYWDSYGHDLETLLAPAAGPKAVECGEGITAEPAPPVGMIERTRDVQFFAVDFDYETRERVRLGERRGSDLTNLMWDEAVLADGTEVVVAMARDDATVAIRLEPQIELLVGPWVRSRGPGPFAAQPAGVRFLVDPAWDLLELYRAGAATNLAWRPPPWWFIEPTQIGEAISELSTVDPDRTGPLGSSGGRGHEGDLNDNDNDLDRDTYDGWYDDWGVERAGWLSWDEAKEVWWPRCRERARALLEEAAAAGDAVVFTRYWPEDQGTIVAPLDDDLGEPISNGPAVLAES